MGMQPARGHLDGGSELGVGEPPGRAVLALPGERAAVRVARDARLERGASVVQLPAEPPARPGWAAARVDHRVRSPSPGDPEVVGGRAPEPARVGDRPRLQRIQGRLAGRPQEPRELRVVQQLRRRPPRDAVAVAPEDRPVVRHGESVLSARRGRSGPPSDGRVRSPGPRARGRWRAASRDPRPVGAAGRSGRPRP